MKRLCRWIVCIALVMVGSARAHAQNVVITVRDSVSGAPLGGAVVSVIDSSGAVLRRVTTDRDGQVSVAGVTGSSRLRVIRIGYTPVTRAMSAGAAIDILARRIPPVLSTLRVSEARLCPGSTDRGAAFELWEQARAGLLAVQIARTSTVATVSTRLFRRRLAPNDGQVREESQNILSGRAVEPFAAARDAATLARTGFMTEDASGRTFYGLDDATLLDESFAATHCFQSRPADRAHPGEVGLAFEPIGGRDAFVEVEGTIWMSASPMALHTLEFQFVGLEPAATRMHPGGRVEFETDATGATFATSWLLRMPVLAAQVGRVPQVLRPTTRGRRERTDVRVSEIDEQGGELLEMARAGRVVWRRPPTRIAGRVIRAGTDQPVRGVGLTAVGATAPSFDSLITKACGAAAARAENDAHLLGHLTLPSPGAAGARLSVELQSADTSRSTARVDLDSRGNFRICNITAAMPVRLHVTAGGLRADTVMSLAAGVHSMSWQPSLVSIDRYATHAIRGVVVDSARHPIQGARVTVGAKELASTGEQGRFRIDVPSEADVVLELRRLGYAPVQQLVEREVDTTLVLTMLPAVQQLAGVEVTDRQIPGRLLGFEQRLAARGHATTAQFFITADEIDKRRPDLTSSLFSDIAGMRVLRVNLNEYGIFGLYHGGPCPAAVYIDGQRMPGSNIDTTILPSDIAGIEVYPRANGAPAAYQNLNGGCAVVLIWRKGG